MELESQPYYLIWNIFSLCWICWRKSTWNLLSYNSRSLFASKWWQSVFLSSFILNAVWPSLHRRYFSLSVCGSNLKKVHSLIHFNFWSIIWHQYCDVCWCLENSSSFKGEPHCPPKLARRCRQLRKILLFHLQSLNGYMSTVFTILREGMLDCKGRRQSYWFYDFCIVSSSRWDMQVIKPISNVWSYTIQKFHIRTKIILTLIFKWTVSAFIGTSMWSIPFSGRL